MTQFRVEWSINQSAENESVNLTSDDFFEFKKTAFWCFFEKLMNIALCESTEDFVFLEINEIIARILFWILLHQVLDEFNLFNNN